MDLNPEHRDAAEAVICHACRNICAARLAAWRRPWPITRPPLT